MATVRPKVFKTTPPDPNRKGKTIIETLKLVAPDTKVVRAERESGAVNIAEAEIIVSGGRGLKKGENLAMLRKLAELLGGVMGVSRACVDAGWCSSAHQVGQTGKTVRPKIYLAFGISGAIQHLEGMRASDTIIAVNRDANAPIFGVADLGILGDLFEIAPKLSTALESGKE
jgi:electron transfer flavoprotein alpha subunit